MRSALRQRGPRATVDEHPGTPRKAEAGSQNGQANLYASGLPPSWRLPVEAYGVGYLITGTTLAILAQLVTDQGAFDPSTQLIAWTKYCCTFVLSLALQLLAGARGGGSSGAPSAPASSTTAAAAAAPAADGSSGRKAAWLTAAIGLLDTLSYGLNCLGFARCGSSLTMVVFAACGQVFTAVTSRLLLGKTMTGGQTLGVLLVVAGLIVRSGGKLQAAWLAAATTRPGTAAGASTQAATAAVAGALADSNITLGVALIMLSALGYSLLGCLYEWLSAVRGPAMSHAQVATTTSLIGLLTTSAFQLVYTRPRWQQLVASRMAERGLGWWPVVRLYGVFGALFTAHGLVQGMVLQRAGATALGIISAMRASAVAVASGVLFCSPAAPHQCLTPTTAASAAVVTSGALLWTLTGARKSSQQPAERGPVASPSTAQQPTEPVDHKHGKTS